MITFTEIWANKPVTKHFELSPEGTLQQKTVASVDSGHMRRVQVGSASEFAEVLTGLSTHQCLMYGVPPKDVQLITIDEWRSRGCPNDALPRSSDTISWPSSAGVMLLDYDAPKNGEPPLTRDDLIDLLFRACPEVSDHEMIWWPSTSSMIYAGEQQLRGIRGQRIYLFVQDAADIPRAAKVLNDRLWAMGIGRFEVSKSGSLLERPLFDGSVWQTNRIDFAAGADCGDGLEQRRGRPEVYPGLVGGLLDTAKAMPNLTAEECDDAKRNKNVARQVVAKDAEATRVSWIDAKVDDCVRANPKADRTQARKTIERAVERRDLMGDWPVTVVNAEGIEKEVTVGAILDNPAAFHCVKTLDPLEPDYDGRRCVGKLFLYGARPTLYSFAHGGVVFRLTRQPQHIEVVSGKSREATDNTLDVLRLASEIFDFGAEMVAVENGKVHPLNEHSLSYVLGQKTQYWRRDKFGGEVLLDPPVKVCRNVISLGLQRHLKRLDAVVTAPTLRPDGSVLDTPGFDASSGLLYECTEEPMAVPLFPTQEQIRTALDFLWAPFETFPFCTALDRAVHLSALITAAVRPAIPTSPAFGYDAPVQGSGKTLLARCVGMLTEGSDPAVWPHTAGRDDEEVRKRLMTALRAGSRCLVWDNVMGQFDSASLATCLTSAMYQDRILGLSTSSIVPNRAVFVLTGNNLQLSGDLPRRVLMARIDPETDKPFARSFDLDPLGYCRINRQRMIISALTVVRGMLMLGCQSPGAGAMASFEDWDRLVRQTVIFANEISGGKFGDVMDVVVANQSIDPEQETLLELLKEWKALFGHSVMTTAEVLKRSENWQGEKLRSVLEEFAHGRLTARSIGKLLRYRAGRIVGGLRFEDAGRNAGGARLWRVAQVT